jgi:hypothetical protein
VECEQCQCQWVARGCDGAQCVIEMNMKHRTYLGCWLSEVRSRAAGCASRKRDAARLALSSGMGGVNGQLEQRVRVTCVLFRNELPFLVKSLYVGLACSGY